MWCHDAGLRTPLTIVAVGVLLAGPAFAAPSPEKGAAISAQCAVCHGSNGISVDTSIPNLAGQHYPYLLEQMNAFKQRTRKVPIMNELAAPLSEQQVEDLAAYFSSIPFRAGTAAKTK